VKLLHRLRGHREVAIAIDLTVGKPDGPIILERGAMLHVCSCKAQAYLDWYGDSAQLLTLANYDSSFGRKMESP
jgi:hypothetical protein